METIRGPSLWNEKKPREAEHDGRDADQGYPVDNPVAGLDRAFFGSSVVSGVEGAAFGVVPWSASFE